MRRRSMWAIPLLSLCAGLARAQDAGSGSVTVTACETLIAARRFEAAPRGPDAPAPAPECRTIARARIGDVERRAMIGGAPYECLTVAEAGRCLWIVP